MSECNRIQIKVEDLRNKLKKLISLQALDGLEVLATSQILDRAINEYYYFIREQRIKQQKLAP